MAKLVKNTSNNVGWREAATMAGEKVLTKTSGGAVGWGDAVNTITSGSYTGNESAPGATLNIRRVSVATSGGETYHFIEVTGRTSTQSLSQTGTAQFSLLSWVALTAIGVPNTARLYDVTNNVIKAMGNTNNEVLYINNWSTTNAQGIGARVESDNSLNIGLWRTSTGLTQSVVANQQFRATFVMKS